MTLYGSSGQPLDYLIEQYHHRNVNGVDLMILQTSTEVSPAPLKYYLFGIYIKETDRANGRPSFFDDLV